MTNPFTSDGCSGPIHWIWQTLYQKAQPSWCQCCIVHDWEYYNGGTESDRAAADAKLFNCVVAQGWPWWAIFVWLGVRIGCARGMPWRSSWGWKDAVPKTMD